jgi:hypothetical protein
MASLNDIQKAVKDIFDSNDDLNLNRWRTSFAGSDADKQVDEINFESKDQVFEEGASTIVIRPRIKDKKQRTALINGIEKIVEDNIETVRQKFISHLDTSESYVIELQKKIFPKSSSIALRIETYKLKIDKNGNTSKPSRPIWKILIQSKGLSNGSTGKRSDPHEIMTAALILGQTKYDYSKINTLPDERRQKFLYRICKHLSVLANRVQGASGKDGIFVDDENGDYANLAKALSISNYVLEEIGKDARVKAVWQTGTSWASEVKQFNVGPKTIKNYNSSDIIVKFEKNSKTHYWGLSLKKRGINEVEPTLLNKPLLGKSGFLVRYLKPERVKKVQDAKKTFFINGVSKIYGTPASELSKLDIKQLAKKLDLYFTDEKKNQKNQFLTGTGEFSKLYNIYFEALDKLFTEEFDKNEEFFKDFLDTIFKIDLTSYLKGTNFHFSLITGEGDYKNGKVLEIKKPSEKEGKTMTEIFTKIFGKYSAKKDAFRIMPLSNYLPKKINAFEKGATAAKLYYCLVINKIQIVDIEVRYKGSFGPEPQFQVFLTDRRNSLKSLYSRISKMKLSDRDRWS